MPSGTRVPKPRSTKTVAVGNPGETVAKLYEDVKPLRVLLNADALLPPLTGLGQYTWNLAHGLDGHKALDHVVLFTHGGFPKLQDFAAETRQEQGAGTTRLLSRLRPMLAKSSLAVKIYEQVMPWVYSYRMKAFARDYILHSPNFVLPPYSGVSIATFHDLSTLRYADYHPRARVDFVNRAMDRAVGQASHIITDTEHVRQEVMEQFGISEDRCTAIPLGADSVFHPRDETACRTVLDRHSLMYREFCLFVSTIEPRKNLLRLLSAYERCWQHCQSPLPLVVIGGVGWHSEKEHKLMRSLAGRGLVQYLGYVPQDELPLYYAAAKAFVFPSLYEGFGLPVLEAMQSGTSVLTSGASAMSEVCGGAAVLVNPLDVEDITEGLKEILHNDANTADRVSQGLERAARFSWERCVSQTVQVYKEAAR